MFAHESGSIAQAIVDTINLPFLVQDRELRVVEASRASYRAFNADPADTKVRHLSELCDRLWNRADLISLLKAVVDTHQTLDVFEVDGELSGCGRRIMHIDAREMGDQRDPMVLMDIIEITAAQRAERDAKELLQRKDVLLEEMSHRIANSLMMIASILLLRSQTERNEEARQSLKDAHQRVIAIASVQKQMQTLVEADNVELQPYLSALWEAWPQP